MKNDLETIEQEISENGSRKIMLGLRCYPELKNRLLQESAQGKLTLSEHCENILLNRDAIRRSNEQVREENKELQEKISQLQAQIDQLENEAQSRVTVLTNENNKLKKSLQTQQNAGHILKEPRLLEIFAAVKNKTYPVEINGVKEDVTFYTPQDLLTVIINTYKVKTSSLW